VVDNSCNSISLAFVCVEGGFHRKVYPFLGVSFVVMKYLLLLSLLLFLVVPVGAISDDDGVSVPLVADYIGGGFEQGVFLDAFVVVGGGDGHVFVDTSPYAQVDLQGSARLAAMVASDITGIDQAGQNFYYVINVPSPIIGGPSAGAALTVATVAAINDWSFVDGVAMTGTISPDNSIGPVGGIPHKLEAAAENGVTLFLIPEGQRKITILDKTEKSGPGFVFTEAKTEVIDLVEMGEELGVRVEEVSDIYEAIWLMTGEQVMVEEAGGEVISGDYIEALEPLAASLRVEASGMYNETALLVDTDLLKGAEEILQRADEMYDGGNYYAATSLYFNAMVVLRSLQWCEEYNRTNNKSSVLVELRERVFRQINASELDIERFKTRGVRDPETIGAAESRATRARQMVDHAETSDPMEYIKILAFANERARTAQWWLTLTKSELIVPEEELRRRAGWYLAQAQSVTTYAETLLSESMSYHTSLPGTAGEDVISARSQFERGYYSGAIFDSIHAIVKASTIIGLLSAGDVTERVKKSEQEAKNAIMEARRRGIEPTLAISAYEYGKTLAEAEGQITQYKYARSVAKTTVILNSKGVNASNTTNPAITEVTHAKIKPTTVKNYKSDTETRGRYEHIRFIPAPTIHFVIACIIVSAALFSRRRAKR